MKKLLILLLISLPAQAYTPTSNLETNQSMALLDYVEAEFMTGTDYEKKTAMFFFDSQAKKHNNDYVKEWHSRAMGGAKRYSGNSKAFLKKLRGHPIYEIKKIWDKNIRLVLDFSVGKIEPDATQHKVMGMTNYITIELAKKKMPKWSKYYLVDFIIIGDTIYMKCDWSKRQLQGYNKLMEELK